MHPFLLRWHAAHPGATADAFAHMTRPDGRSSYDTLADLAEGAQDVLDLCCGDGLLIELTENRWPGVRLVGVDGSPQELAAARARLGPSARLIEADVAALPLPDGSVDLALCHMALMLLDDVEGALAELARVLRPGGRFAAVVGAAQRSPGYQVYLDALLHQLRVEAPPKVRLVDGRTLSEDGLAELFAGPAWSGVQSEVFEVSTLATPEQAWETVHNMYDLERLSPEGQAEVRRRSLEVWRASGGPVVVATGMRLVEARRAL